MTKQPISRRTKFIVALAIIGAIIFGSYAIYLIYSLATYKGDFYPPRGENVEKETIVLNTNYINTVEWPPVTTIQTGVSSVDCKETRAESSLPDRVRRQTINGRDYCISTRSEGAAGKTYTMYTYTTIKNNNLVKVDFTLKYPQCLNYDEPEKTACTEERENFNLDELIDRLVRAI